MKLVVNRSLIYFVSSSLPFGISQAGMHIYARASAKGKRVQVSAILPTPSLIEVKDMTTNH